MDSECLPADETGSGRLTAVVPLVQRSACYCPVMELPSAPNPFVPGDGQMPPFLAGRELEQKALIGLLAYLRAGPGAPYNAVLSGPRETA